jgi:hypothetical protein
MGNGATFSGNDSTANANNVIAGSLAPTTGIVNGGAVGPGAIPTGHTNFPSGSNPSTMEMWVQPTGVPSSPSSYDDCGTTVWTYYDFPMEMYGNGGGGSTNQMLLENPGDGTMHAEYSNNATGIISNRTLNVGSWYQIVSTFDGTTGRLYINGSLDNSAALTQNVTISSAYIGYDATGNSPSGSGTFDEARISASARSAGWIWTEYKNISAPASFYTVQ